MHHFRKDGSVMAIEEEYLSPEKLPLDLTREIGAVKSVEEFVPGVYYLSAQKENAEQVPDVA